MNVNKEVVIIASIDRTDCADLANRGAPNKIIKPERIIKPTIPEQQRIFIENMNA